MTAYSCDCCSRVIVPAKLKGIGYVCDDCLPSWCWTGYEHGEPPAPHYPACPFKGQAPLPVMCPGGCGCRLGTEDADMRECGCDEGCCEDDPAGEDD